MISYNFFKIFFLKFCHSLSFSPLGVNEHPLGFNKKFLHSPNTLVFLFRIEVGKRQKKGSFAVNKSNFVIILIYKCFGTRNINQQFKTNSYNFFQFCLNYVNFSIFQP